MATYSNNGHKQTATPIATQYHATVKDPFQVMQRAFDNALDNFFDKSSQETLFAKDWERLSLIPSLDIVDEGSCLKVVAELPGMGIEDIKLSLDNNTLTICGEKSVATHDKRKNYLRREIGYGSYARSFALPAGLNTDKATATFKKGMLWISIPKRHAAGIQSKRRLKVMEIK